MSRRRRYKERSKIWPWVSFVMFGAILGLLGFSIVKKISPAQLIKNIFSKEKSPDNIYDVRKSELIKIIKNRDVELNELKEELANCQANGGYLRAIITTKSNTLNMREEASLSSSVIIKIPNGSVVSILYYDDRELFLDGSMGQWCKVKYADQEGWVWGNYLTQQE